MDEKIKTKERTIPSRESQMSTKAQRKLNNWRNQPALNQFGRIPLPKFVGKDTDFPNWRAKIMSLLSIEARKIVMKEYPLPIEPPSLEDYLEEIEV
jgi:hypothetical protein